MTQIGGATIIMEIINQEKTVVLYFYRTLPNKGCFFYRLGD